MRRTQTQHLTDADFSDALTGQQPGETIARHLAECSRCRAEIEQLRSSLAAFGDLSCKWAEAIAPAKVPVPSRWALGLTGWPTLATGVLVTALTGVLVFNFGPSSRGVSSQQTDVTVASRAAATPTKTELANDNRLMLSIDEELSYRTRPEASVSDLGAQASASTSSPSVVVVN